MATIEERAYEYARKNDTPSSWFCELENSYIAGAKDQKAIDDAELHERFQKVLSGQKWDLIDTMCEWMKKKLTKVEKINSGEFVTEYQRLSSMAWDEIEKEYRKTMED